MTGGAGASSCTTWATSRGALVLEPGPPYCHNVAVSSRATTAVLRPLLLPGWLFKLTGCKQADAGPGKVSLTTLSHDKTSTWNSCNRCCDS